MTTYLIIFGLWWIVGVISFLAIVKREGGEVWLSDFLLSIFLVGLFGGGVTLILLLLWMKKYDRPIF